jgi:hypothetical protein
VKTFLNFKRLPFLCAVLALSAVFSFSTAIAQNTSSSLRVVVTDANGAPASGVRVNVTHVPTGRSQVVASSTQGLAAMRGLAVGGPYEVSVVGGGDYAADVIQNIYLELDKTAVVDLAVRSVIEEIMVTAVAPTGEVAVGVGRAFDRATLDATPSISRDFVSALATDPKIMVDNSVARGPAVSMAGQNFRFNSLTIDGVPQNDNFGLSKNASATQRTPISIDAIEAITVVPTTSVVAPIISRRTTASPATSPRAIRSAFPISRRTPTDSHSVGLSLKISCSSSLTTRNSTPRVQLMPCRSSKSRV